MDLLLSVQRDAPGTLGAQIEDQLRRAIRDGRLRAGARVPSTRDLARQLGVSRRITVDAYGQLAAEGYLVLRQGARPEVSQAAGAGAIETTAGASALAPRYDFQPSVPDVSTFPRRAWQRAVREALTTMSDFELAYGDPRGVESLRAALADYLGRVRGVVADSRRIVVTSGYSQGLGVVCQTLKARGATRIAFEDPCFAEQREIAARAGLEPVAVPVDGAGLRVVALAEAAVDAVVLTPAHQHPTGVVLAGERRTARQAWLREHNTIANEDDYNKYAKEISADDYDAEYRYDRAAIGALQGLEPDRVIYAGSASKTLAPALRLGWLVVPPALVEEVTHGKVLADRQTSRIDQHAFAGFLLRGELDRHLRRMRVLYRERRDVLVAALAEELPEAVVRGIAAGLHATVELPEDDDEQAIVEEARRRRIVLSTLGEHVTAAEGYPPTLLLGYGQIPTASVRPAVRELAAAVRAARA